MARVHVPITVLDNDGVPVSGASVTIRKRADNSLVNVYSSEAGGTPVANPAATDAKGRVDRWIERDAVKMTVTATGLDTYDEYWDAFPAGDATLDGALLANSTVPKGKLATDALNAFLKLNAAADRKVAFGTGIITFSTVNRAFLDVAHGLGTTPMLVICMPKDGGTFFGGFPMDASVIGATTFRAHAEYKETNTVSGTLHFYWVAVA